MTPELALDALAGEEQGQPDLGADTLELVDRASAEQAVVVPVGTYLVQVVASGTTTVLTSEQIGLADQSAAFTYAAGEAANNSVGLVDRTIRDVF